MARWARLEQTLHQLVIVAKMRAEGATMEAIAARVGRPMATLRRWVAKLQVLEKQNIRRSERDNP